MNKKLVAEMMRGIRPRIRSLLKENGIDVKDASEDLSIDLSHYYRLLRGDRPMTVDNIIAHSEYLNVSVLYLMFGLEIDDIKRCKEVSPGEINVMIDMVIEASKNLDDASKKEKILKILNVLIVLIKTM